MVSEMIGAASFEKLSAKMGTPDLAGPSRGKSSSSASPLKPPLFKDVSSDALLQQQKPSKVAVLVVHDREHEFIVEIPAPTKSDISTAQSLAKKDTSDRNKIMRKMLEKQNTWMVAYMCAVYREDGHDIGWFNPNKEYDYEFKSSRTMLSLAAREGDAAGVGILLQCEGLNVLRNGGYGEYRNGLTGAVYNKDKSEGYKMLEMLLVYNFEISDKHILNANDKDMRRLLTDTRRARQAEEKKIEKRKRKALAETKAKEEQEQAKAEAQAQKTTLSEEDGIVWAKLDNSSISKITQDSTGFRLRKVFNFQSSTVSECNEYLDADGALQTATPPVVTAFRQLGGMGEVKQAQEKLKSLLAARTEMPEGDASPEIKTDVPKRKRVHRKL